jgi:hypothetical protein
MLIPFGVFASSGTGVLGATIGYVLTGGSTGLIQKLSLTTETTSTSSSTLGRQTGSPAGFGNIGVAVYAIGGIGASNNFLDSRKIALSTDTVSSLSAPSPGRYGIAGFQDSAVAGYAAGGDRATFYTFSAAVDKYSFPSDTRTNLGSGLSAVRFLAGAFDNSATAGYVAGGDNFAMLTVVDKFAFPGDTRTTLGTGLSVARYALSGFQNSGVAGYAVGGVRNVSPDIGAQTVIDKFSYPSDTRSTLSPGLQTGRQDSAGLSRNSQAGYAAGGNSRSDIEKFAFPSDTRSILSATLNTAGNYIGASA